MTIGRILICGYKHWVWKRGIEVGMEQLGLIKTMKDGEWHLIQSQVDGSSRHFQDCSVPILSRRCPPSTSSRAQAIGEWSDLWSQDGQPLDHPAPIRSTACSRGVSTGATVIFWNQIESFEFANTNHRKKRESN
ncbi:hypothetical protein CROQUDRAFT_98143 [Cronartium quercuum f. sp. fusiforme G11]|uniref:Uncharacterized protein n=1 Tax=Cronartium quercuum f. sp. fusiforme G11 TaxID=708437 RepID=A0A9P6NCX8_9BASI|nr:hypothetical protein CROQUDRAFT_98143 [Cronartium quercuum f. sp. fusiforme G11]